MISRPHISLLQSALIAGTLLLISACSPPGNESPNIPDRAVQPLRFPAPDRPVASGNREPLPAENARDDQAEFEMVVESLGLKPGITIADIGAGSGYYTVRLSPIIGPSGRIYANDIIPDYITRLKNRANELTNISYVLGDAGDARLPEGKIDVALMVHMYHEIEDPFSLMWHLHDSLKKGDARPQGVGAAALSGDNWRGKVAIIDYDRPTSRHGTPAELLRCEMRAVGYHEISFDRLDNNIYVATFEPAHRPDPDAIEPCQAE